MTAVGIFVLQWRNGQKADDAKKAAERSAAALVETANGIFEVGKAVNGTVSDFLKAKEAECAARVEIAYAKGVAAGEQAQRDRQAPPQP